MRKREMDILLISTHTTAKKNKHENYDKYVTKQLRNNKLSWTFIFFSQETLTKAENIISRLLSKIAEALGISDASERIINCSKFPKKQCKATFPMEAKHIFEFFV